MFQTVLENGVIKYTDSPLLRAIIMGRVIVIDEADKAAEDLLQAVLDAMSLIKDIKPIHSRPLLDSLADIIRELQDSVVEICIFLGEYLRKRFFSMWLVTLYSLQNH